MPWELWDKKCILQCDLLYLILAVPETAVQTYRQKNIKTVFIRKNIAFFPA